MKMDNLEDIYELSPLQQGLLFHTIYAPQSGVYFEQFSWTLKGNLNATALRQAWQRVVDRHVAGIRAQVFGQGCGHEPSHIEVVERKDHRANSPG